MDSIFILIRFKVATIFFYRFQVKILKKNFKLKVVLTTFNRIIKKFLFLKREVYGTNRLNESIFVLSRFCKINKFLNKYGFLDPYIYFK